MNLREYLNFENLHHAYLIEGQKNEVLGDLFALLSEVGIDTLNNPDLVKIEIDNLKIAEALGIRSLSKEKANKNEKKIILVSVNSITLDAQNTLLKMFEEPILDTHFFVIVPDTNVLLDTFISRFNVVKTDKKSVNTFIDEFIEMNLSKKLAYLKSEFGSTKNDSLEESQRTKAIDFLNSIEIRLQKMIFKKNISSNVEIFDQIIRVRQSLRQPGSSPKMLLESVAILIPDNLS